MLLKGELCYRVQGCVYEVYRQLGHGYLEKVYERALCRELEFHGLSVKCQVPFTVSYKGAEIGEYFADMVVEDAISLGCASAQLSENERSENRPAGQFHISQGHRQTPGDMT